MALLYVLTQAGNKMGLSPQITGERNVLLRFANESAIELYQTSDMAGSLMEQYFNVNANQCIAMPDYVGQLRAMRQACSFDPIKLSQLRPRYNELPWKDEWRNWRLKGKECLQVSIRNQSLITFVVAKVENPPITINITGSTDTSSSISETVVMSSLAVTTVNAYNNITAITKNTVSTYDVIVNDIDGKQISRIPNNKLESLFQIIDVSTCPWIPPNTNPLLTWVEVLFKKALPWYQDDNQEFPAPGYDNVWVNKLLQLWCEEQGKTQDAIGYYQKAISSLAAIHEDANRGTDDTVSLCVNPHDRLFGRVGMGRDYWYAWRVEGR